MKINRFYLFYYTLLTLITTILILIVYNIKLSNIIDKNKIEIQKLVEKDNIPSKYEFMNKMIYLYIDELCQEKNIDKNLCISILYKENQNFQITAININSNGTIDCGLWQLNDKFTYCEKGFLNCYWNRNEEFDMFNWKHNTYIAISLIGDLYNYFQDIDYTVMAYNCGLSRVANKKIPNSTKKYLKDVKKTYNMLIKE